MRAKGMTYSTGFVRHGRNSRTDFDPDVVRRELEIIRDDLHCTAVQVIGGDADRLELACRFAAELGLEVWFSPYPLELPRADMLTLFADCAQRAERIRAGGADVVFVTGVELTLMNQGFLEGDDLEARVRPLLDGTGGGPQRLAEASGALNDFLAEAVGAVRARFGGRLTYCAIPFERVDWDLFDIVSVELIRSAEVADRYRDGVRSLVAGGKPVAITGFGCATWYGAGDVAPRAMEIVEYADDGTPARLDGDYLRDEQGQATYLREVLTVFEDEGVDSAFVFLFALYDFPRREGPRRDLDLASFGVVSALDGGTGRTYDGMPWEPKAAFHTVAECYSR